jgi:Domain of unknown function (DUF4158)
VSKAAQAAPFPEPWSCSTKEEAQLSIGPESATLALSDRTVERHRAEIRTLLGFREATIADGEALTEWLRDHAVADSRNKGSAIEELGTTRMWQSAPAQQQVADGPPLNRGENYAIARLEASLSEAFVAKAKANRLPGNNGMRLYLEALRVGAGEPPPPDMTAPVVVQHAGPPPQKPAGQYVPQPVHGFFGQR